MFMRYSLMYITLKLEAINQISHPEIVSANRNRWKQINT